MVELFTLTDKSSRARLSSLTLISAVSTSSFSCSTTASSSRISRCWAKSPPPSPAPPMTIPFPWTTSPLLSHESSKCGSSLRTVMHHQGLGEIHRLRRLALKCIIIQRRTPQHLSQASRRQLDRLQLPLRFQTETKPQRPSPRREVRHRTLSGAIAGLQQGIATAHPIPIRWQLRKLQGHVKKPTKGPRRPKSQPLQS